MSNNFNEEINPSQVILDPEFAQTATSNDIINPAEVVLDPEFAAPAPAVDERSDREKLEQIFSSDALAFIADPNQRRALENSINAADDPEAARKKIAVAAFYSNMDPAGMGMIYDNFDRSMELAVGKITTPDAAYQQIADVVKDKKHLSEDMQQYVELAKAQNQSGTAALRALGGMAKNIGVGLDMALMDLSTTFRLLSGKPGSGKDAFGNFRATGWFGAQQSAAIDEAQGELARVKSEEEFAKRSAFAKAYKLDELGIPALPPEPVWSKKPFGSAMDEENKAIWQHYYTQLKENKAFDFLPDNVATYAELEKLYTDEVTKRYAEKFGDTAAADQEYDRAAMRADWKGQSDRNQIWQEIDYNDVQNKIVQWRGYFEKQFKANADMYHPGDIDSDTLSMIADNGNFGQIVGKTLALAYDQVARSIVPMILTANAVKPLRPLATGATTAIFAGEMYGQGAGTYIDAKQNDLQAVKDNVETYAATYAAAEVIPELLLGWIPLGKKLLAMGKPTREVLKQKMLNGALDYGRGFIKAGAMDTGGEMITLFSEKLLDAVYDVNLPNGKKWEDLTDEEKNQFLKDGILETLVVSMFTAGAGGAVETAGKRQTIAEKNLRKERVRQVLDARIAELGNKEELTDEENSELRQLLTLDDASNLDDALSAAQKIVVKQAMEPVNTIAETANADIPDDIVEAAGNALIRQRISTAVHWNVEKTVKQAQALSPLFPDFALTVYRDHSELPADLRSKIVAAGMTPERVRAFIMPDTNDVYLIANRVRPSDVARTIGHEIIGHRGIRAVFGEDYDNLLDLVYRDHADEINALAGAYRRNPANNIANQRYLAEEFLANCADAKVKPSWWKELIAKIRAWLRERYPSLQFTQKDIEGVLSMAARRVRKGTVRNSRTADGDMRFAVIGEYGASRLAEAETLTANLATAKTMLEAGKDARTIKLATGWEKGGDGLWRMEIPDMEFKADNFTAPVTLNGHLQDLVDAPELFAAYPDLRGLMVLTTDNLPDNVAARHTTDLSGDAIFFNRKYFAPTPAQQRILERAEKDINRSYNWTEKDTKAAQMLRIEMNPQILRQEAYAAKDQVRNEQLAKFRRTFIHEIQHAIQFEEGFAEGSSTQRFKEFPVKDKTLYKALNDAMQTEYEIRTQLAEYPDAYHAAERYFELDDVYFSDDQIDEQAILDEMDRLDDEIRTAGIADLWDKYQIAVRDRRAAQLKYDNSALSPQEAYRRTAGEVEARNASRRADMSMDERRQTLLADTADVAEEDMIYLESLWSDGADMSPLRRDGAPNTAEQKGQLRDGNVPHVNGFMKWAGLRGNRIAADYEFLFGRHPQYFKSQEEARAAVELVLSKPEKMKDIGKNLSFAGFDEETGAIYRIEIDPTVKNKFNYVRSVFEITASQYEKDKLAEFPVLQPSPTEDNQSAGRSLASFLRYDNSDSEKVKSENEKNEEIKFSDLSDGSDKSDGMRFSVSPVYTGSAADYDAPSLQYINSGEGAQVYGWGLYGSSSREVAEWYAKADAKRKYSREAALFDGKEFDYGFSDGTLLDEIKMTTLIDVKKHKGDIDAVIKEYQGYIDESVYPESEVEWLEQCIDFLENNRDRITYRPAGDDDMKRNIYQQTFWPGKKEVLLDWDKEVPEDIRQKIADQAVAEGLPFAYTENGKNILNESGTGEFIYNALTKPYNQLGSPKSASEFLYRAGIDGITYIGDSSGVRNYVAFADADIRVDEHIKFLLSEYSEDQTSDIVAILRPFVGYYLAKEDADYQAHLKSLGIDVDIHDAHAFAVLAMRENQADQAARSAEKRKKSIEARNKARSEYLYNSIPLYREAIDFAGSEDFTIKPSARFRGEEFSGSWISPEFVKFSKAKKKDPSKLDAASGINSDEFAESLARKWGRDALEVEQEIIDFFRDLKKRDLYKEYTDFRNESIMADKEEDRLAREEFEASERARIEDEAMYILENGLPVTDEFISENKKVYEELHRMMFQQEPPAKPRKKDVEAMNAYLAADPAAAGEGFAEGFRQGREQSLKEFREQRKADREKDWSEFQARLDKLRETAREQRKADREKAWQAYQERLHQLKEKVMSNKTNALELQKDAWNYAKSHLDPEYRGEFVTSIINLLELSTQPTDKHPEGHRMTEFRNLLHKINMRSRTVRTNRNLQEFMDLLDAAKTMRTFRGVVFSKLPEVQTDIDNIRKISAMNAAAVASAIKANNEKIMELSNLEDPAAATAELVLANEGLKLFGDIANADADRMSKALTVLRDVVTKGKEHYKVRMDERLHKFNAMRSAALDEITSGKNEISSVDNKQFSDQMLKNSSLASLMRLVAKVSDEKFDNSAIGKIYRNIENASWAEATSMRELQELFDRHIAEIHGEANANTLARMRSKGQFLRDIMQEQENTGIYIREYSRIQYFDKENKPIKERGKRNLIKKFVPVEDYIGKSGKKLPGIRTLLQLIDNGEKVEKIAGLPVTDMTLHFLRQQLADYDAGVDAAYDLFGNDSDNSAYDALMKEERQQAKLMVIAPDTVGESEIIEMKLSKAQAMQVLLTWEQEDYQDAMRWNGWDDRSIEQLKKFLGDDLVDFAYWMRKVIKDNSAKLDEKVYQEFGTHLPENTNYFPGAFVTSRGKNLEQNKQRMDLDKSFLIARRFHLNPIDYSVDAVSTFMQNQMAQAHYLAWADTIREVKAVFGNVKIRLGIQNQFGSNVYSNLMERLTVIAAGAGDGGSGFAASMMRNAFKYWVPAKIAFNVGSMLKQLAGAAAYANDVPLKEFAKYTSQAVIGSEKYRNFLKFALNSDYIKNRMGGGMDKDFIYINQLSRDVKDYSLWADTMLRAGTWGTRQMDKLAALKAGYAVYQYNYDKAIASGMSATDAERAARHAWMRSTDETQQSGFLKDQNFFQSNQGALRIFTTFMSNPIQIMNREWQTINAIRRGDEKAKKLLARQIFVNHFLVPSMMLFVNDMLKRGFDPDNWEDFEWEDYFFAWIAGPWESFYLWGKLGMMAANMVGDAALDRKFKFQYNSISALPIVDEAMSDLQFLMELGKKDNWQPADYLRIIKAAGSAGMVAGPWVSVLGGIGALLNALGSQGSRFAKWFEEKPMGRGPF